MSPPTPIALPADADLYMFSYAKMATPLATRLAEVALRARALAAVPPEA